MLKPSLFILAAMSVAQPAPAAEDPVIAAVYARDDELAAAHGRGDLATYRAGLSRDYVYVDVGGKRVTADLLEQRRKGDQRRVVSSETSEAEAIRVGDNVVLLRGLEHSHAIYYGGLPRISASRWTATWALEQDGVWRLLAETATPVRENDALPFVHVPQPAATLEALTGDWTLALQPPMTLHLAAKDGTLVASLDDQPVRFTFRPASPTHYFAAERPFELRVSADGQTADLVTWGTATKAQRVATTD